MKAEDLMVGDWVLVRELDCSNNTLILAEYQHQLRLKDFSEMYNAGEYKEYKEYEPILLTKEILLKNGFEEFYGGGCIIKELNDDEMPTLYIWDGNDSLYVVDNYSTNKYTYVKECKYVHEFQHELKSCGIEKEIVL